MSKKSKKSTKAKSGKKLKADKKLKNGKNLDKSKKLDKTTKASKKQATPETTLTETIKDEVLYTAGKQLAGIDSSSTPGWSGGRTEAEKMLAKTGEQLSDLQERLFAEGRSGGSRSVLLVLQGMDSSGKGGIVRHVVGLVDPQGVQHASFGKPTAEELRHNFLWRIKKQLPSGGKIGVFDRSHYEDVLIARVNSLAPQDEITKRYKEINAFEAKLAEQGTTIIKAMLHISPEEQKARLAERLERPDKYWKYNPADVDERKKWPAYQEAFQLMLEHTSTDVAPWHIIPANNKWFARLAVSQLLLHVLEGMDLGWPEASFDVEVEKKRLAES